MDEDKERDFPLQSSSWRGQRLRSSSDIPSAGPAFWVCDLTCLLRQRWRCRFDFMRNGRLALQARCLFQFHTNHMCTSMCYNRNCVCGELLRLYFPNVNLYADSTFKCSRGSHETACSRWIDIVMQFSSANSTMGTLNEVRFVLLDHRDHQFLMLFWTVYNVYHWGF